MARSRKSLIDKEVELRHQKIRKLLLAGMNVSQVCKEVGITPKRVYVVAQRWRLPTNPKIWPGSEDESSIARLSACGWTPEKIGKLFNQSPKAIQAIMERVKKNPVLESTARRFKCEETGQGSDRQS